VDYSDLDLHLSIILNEAWAHRDPKRTHSQYLPHTAKVLGQLLRALIKAERAAKPAPPPPDNTDELDTLRRFLHASMIRKAIHEVGHVQPWYDPEVKEWVFEHPAFPVQCAGNTRAEVIRDYPLYLREYIIQLANDNLARGNP